MNVLTVICIELEKFREYTIVLKDDEIVLEGFNETNESDVTDIDSFISGAAIFASSYTKFRLSEKNAPFYKNHVVNNQKLKNWMSKKDLLQCAEN